MSKQSKVHTCVNHEVKCSNMNNLYDTKYYIQIQTCQNITCNKNITCKKKIFELCLKTFFLIPQTMATKAIKDK